MILKNLISSPSFRKGLNIAVLSCASIFLVALVSVRAQTAQLPFAAGIAAAGYGGYGGDECSLQVTPPSSGFGLAINGGAATTNNRYVTLTISGGSAGYMEISNYSNFSNSVIRKYAPSTWWTLTPMSGKKTVYVRFMNSCQLNPTAKVSSSITYSLN